MPFNSALPPPPKMIQWRNGSAAIQVMMMRPSRMLEMIRLIVSNRRPSFRLPLLTDYRAQR